MRRRPLAPPLPSYPGEGLPPCELLHLSSIGVPDGHIPLELLSDALYSTMAGFKEQKNLSAKVSVPYDLLELLASNSSTAQVGHMHHPEIALQSQHQPICWQVHGAIVPGLLHSAHAFHVIPRKLAPLLARPQGTLARHVHLLTIPVTVQVAQIDHGQRALAGGAANAAVTQHAHGVAPIKAGPAGMEWGEGPLEE